MKIALFSDIHANIDALGVEFIRVAYDVEKAAKAVEESRLPDAFAEMLQNER
jgi:hypothetical protein